MIKKWLVVALCLAVSGYITWCMLVDGNGRILAADNVILFVIGPAGLLFLLGAVFGGVYLRPQSSEATMLQQGGAVDEWPEPKRETRPSRIRNRPPMYN